LNVGTLFCFVLLSLLYKLFGVILELRTFAEFTFVIFRFSIAFLFGAGAQSPMHVDAARIIRLVTFFSANCHGAITG